MTRVSVDRCLRRLCAMLEIKGASTHSFRLTWLKEQPEQDVAHQSLYSSRTLGCFRQDPAAQGTAPEGAGKLCDEAPTAPPPLIVDSERGAMAGMRCWQSVRLI